MFRPNTVIATKTKPKNLPYLLLYPILPIPINHKPYTHRDRDIERRRQRQRERDRETDRQINKRTNEQTRTQRQIYKQMTIKGVIFSQKIGHRDGERKIH